VRDSENRTNRTRKVEESGTHLTCENIITAAYRIGQNVSAGTIPLPCLFAAIREGNSTGRS
jgi:hypothetical protein